MKNSEHLYRNPFSEYNANVMDSEQIIEYWCSPFAFAQPTDFAESEMYSDRMPIVFMGGRGTGKTMFLKYYSYYVQCDEALRIIQNKKEKAIITHLQQRGGFGVYLRIDGPVLRSFAGKGVTEEKWDAIFTHYFELILCKLYLEIIRDMSKKDMISKKDIVEKFVPKVREILGQVFSKSTTLEDIFTKVETQLEAVTRFRGQVAFSDLEFKPSVGFASQSLSLGVVEIAKSTITEFNGNKFNFVILIDEYENFLERQQRIINTLFKFVKPGITFRIGMRLEGFHTFDTISKNEFVKEGRDYRKIVFEDILIRDKDYQNFLLEIARKRLRAIPIFKEKNFTNISDFLGKEADLEDEAIQLVKGRRNRDLHFQLLKHVLQNIPVTKALSFLENPENPLLEMLNVLWVLRGAKLEDVQKAMIDYSNSIKSKEAVKYRMDYIDKYKLALMFLLASIYRKNKKYSSFNTFCFLSSGIVGHFIELCRRSFQHAYFEEREELLNQGTISSDLQSKAARDLASSELQMITRIDTYGDWLYHLARNLGNIFRAYHTDIFIRYPETNQFSVDISSIDDEKLEKAFKAAIEWSIIQRKPSLQKTSPGSQKKEIYTLNRIFSPIFEITYRTRGGYSEDYSTSELASLMKEDNIKPKKKLERKFFAEEHLQQDFGFQPDKTE